MNWNHYKKSYIRLLLVVFTSMCLNSVLEAQKISVADGNCLIVCPDGTVNAIGHNNRGQLGDSTYFTKSTAVKVKHLKNITDVSAPASLALQDDGTLWQWTWHGQYRLSKINLSGVKAISSCHIYGASISFAITEDGNLWTWSNAHGKMNGEWLEDTIPKKIEGLPKIKSIKCSSTFNVFIALGEDGSVYTWGGGSDGTQPQKVNSLTNVKAVAAGTGTAYILKNDGTVWYWGWIMTGSWLSGDIRKIDIENVSSISAESVGLYMIKNDGTLWAWGVNSFGELGVGVVYTRGTPVMLDSLSNITEVSTNGYSGLSTIAKKDDETLWAWGYNGYGELGDSTNNRISFPKKIPIAYNNVDCYAKYPDPIFTKLDTFVVSNSLVSLTCSESELYSWMYTWTGYHDYYINSQDHQVFIENVGTSLYASIIDEEGCYYYEKFNVSTTCDTLVKNKDIVVLDTSVYAGETIKLVASEAVSYHWYPWSMSQTNEIIVSSDIECVATLTDSFGCERKERFMLRIVCDSTYLNQPKKIMDTLTYVGKELSLNASGGKLISWSNSNSLSCNDCFNPNLTVTGLESYIATIENDYGCIHMEEFVIRIADCDTIVTNDNLLKLDTLIQPGSTVLLNASEALNYNWSPVSGLSCTSCRFPTAAILTDKEYVVSLTDKYNCSWTERFKITNDCDSSSIISPIIALDTVTYPSAVIDLNATDAETYTWIPDLGLDCNNCKNPSVSVTEPIEYFVSMVDIYGCNSKEVFKIKIRDCDTIVTNDNLLKLDTLIQPGSTVQLNASEAMIYIWSPVNGLSCTSCRFPTAAILTDKEYVVSLTDKYNCSWTERFKIINDCDNSSIISPSIALDTVTYPSAVIDLKATDAETYTWIPDIGLDCNNCKNPSVSVTEPVEYFVSMVDIYGCNSKEVFKIKIRDCDTIPPFDRYIVKLDTMINYTSDLPLLASSSSQGYIWIPTDGLDCFDCQNPIAAVNESIAYNVKTFDNWHCELIEHFNITLIRNDVIIPNVFTPNNNGINDYFEILGLVGNSSLKIFDNNGMLVFSSNNYSSDWDGNHTNGSQLIEGTYWYLLNVPESGDYKGWVYLKR